MRRGSMRRPNSLVPRTELAAPCWRPNVDIWVIGWAPSSQARRPTLSVAGNGDLRRNTLTDVSKRLVNWETEEDWRGYANLLQAL